MCNTLLSFIFKNNTFWKTNSTLLSLLIDDLKRHGLSFKEHRSEIIPNLSFTKSGGQGWVYKWKTPSFFLLKGTPVVPSDRSHCLKSDTTFSPSPEGKVVLDHEGRQKSGGRGRDKLQCSPRLGGKGIKKVRGKYSTLEETKGQDPWTSWTSLDNVSYRHVRCSCYQGRSGD